MATILELVQAACYEGNIAAPSTLVGSSLDLSTLQLVHLTYATVRELRAARVWPQLKRRHIFDLEGGRSDYPLPEDFYAAIPDTEYDRNSTYALNSATDAAWNAVAYSGLTGSLGYDFRIFGPDINPTTGRGQFQIMPTPGDSVTGQTVSFEYISRTWLLPTAWAPGATIALNDYRSSNGNIYKATVAGTTQAASIPYRGPTVTSRGIGQDGGVFWRAIVLPTWAPNKAYRIGDHVRGTDSFNDYVCTTGGTSSPGGSGPIGWSGSAIVDGTVIWKWVATTAPKFNWNALTAYPSGSYIRVIDSILLTVTTYLAVTPSGNSGQLTGKLVPKWFSDGTERDANVTWQAQTAPYDRILSDTDRCLFDDELMIAGLKWRFLRARGLEYQDLQAEYVAHKDAAVSRWQPQQKISLAGDCLCWPPYPRVPNGNWSL
jgi:hypothetical protein